MREFLKCECELQLFIDFQDPNVKLIRELRSEIDRLKSIIRKTESGDEVKVFYVFYASKYPLTNQSDLDYYYFFNKASLTDSAKAAKKLHENQARVEQLTKDWTEKWKEAQSIMQVGTKATERDGTGATG